MINITAGNTTTDNTTTTTVDKKAIVSNTSQNNKSDSTSQNILPADVIITSTHQSKVENIIDHGDIDCDNSADMTAEYSHNQQVDQHHNKSQTKVSDESDDVKDSKDTAAAKKKCQRRPAQAVYVPPRGRGTATSDSGSTKLKMVLKSPKKAVNLKSGKDDIDQTDKLKSDDPNQNVNGKEDVGAGVDVTDQVVAEITAAVGGVQIEEPEVDYISFQTSDSSINIDQFGHVIELYDFPCTYKTSDLINAFQAFTSR